MLTGGSGSNDLKYGDLKKKEKRFKKIELRNSWESRVHKCCRHEHSLAVKNGPGRIEGAKCCWSKELKRGIPSVDEVPEFTQLTFFFP